MPLAKLVLSNFTTRRVRAALTLAAVAMAVSLVVAVTTGYSSIEGAIFKYLSSYLGATDVQISNVDWRKGMNQSLVESLKNDDEVAHVFGRFTTDTGLLDKDGKYKVGPVAELIGLDRPADDDITRTPMMSGNWFDSNTGDVAVIDQKTAERQKVGLGDTIVVPGPGGKRSLKIVGICRKPAFFADRMQSIYVPLRTAQELTQRPGQVTEIMLRLRSVKMEADFVNRWKPKLAAIDPNLKMKTARDTRKMMETQLSGVRFISLMASAVALLSAAFIIMSTLSMGVAERQRSLAMLRAIGAFGSQVVRMVVIEGALLGLAGSLLGVPLGLAWAWLLAKYKHDFFTAGVIVDWTGIVLGVAGSLIAAVLAGIMPAWNASRVSPLEAMTPLAHGSRMRLPRQIALLVIGVLLLLTDTMLLASPAPRTLKMYGHFILGLPALMVGCFLLAPIAVIWIEKLAVGSTAIAVRVLDRLVGSSAAARLVVVLGMAVLSGGVCVLLWRGFSKLPLTGMGAIAGPIALVVCFTVVGCHAAGWLLVPFVGKQRQLLRNQLSGAVWQAAGTCAALMLGVAILIALQTVGHSMLNGWRLPTRFPDIFIWTTNQQLNDKQWGELSKIKGIRDGEVMPLVIGTPGLPKGFWSLVGSALLPDATMFVGVDPDKALKMMELEFRQGTPESAEAALKKGGHVIVTEEFHVLKGLNLGDKLPLMTQKGPRDFIICGVVWSPGIDVMVSMFDLRGSIEQRTAMTVFGSLADAKKYFGWDEAFLFAANLDMGVDKEVLLKSVREQVGDKGWKVGDVRKIKSDIIKGFERLLMLLTTVAFAAMAVAALGVANTVMASVRSRQWQFGILRSIGVTSGQLLRLVIAEAFLLGLIGSAIGLGAGFLMAANGMSLSRSILGYVTEMTPPWGPIGLGLVITLGISLLASLWPAISAARSEPLALLQSGRSGT